MLVLTIIICVLLGSASYLYGAIKAIKNGFSYWQFEKHQLGFKYSIFSWFTIFCVFMISGLLRDVFFSGIIKIEERGINFIYELLVFIVIFLVYAYLQKLLLKKIIDIYQSKLK